MQIPEHLACENTLLENARFWNHTPGMRMFLNCARTWCSQAGILDKTAMDQMGDKAKHVESMTKLLNRLLGMNLQQQQIVFGVRLQQNITALSKNNRRHLRL